MTTTKKNQSRPIRLSLVQALRLQWLVEDLAGRKLTAAEDAILMPLAEQVQLIHAQIHAEFDDCAKPGPRAKSARDIPIRKPKSVDKSR
jgi:hypothetical protein